MTLFWVDKTRDTYLSYEDLISEINARAQRRPIVKTDDPSEVFIEILLAILGHRELTLLDPEFSSDTLSSLGYDADTGSQKGPAPATEIASTDDLISKIANANDRWTIRLYTSGTTGTPTEVDQTLEGITRSVRQSDRFRNDVWAFAYNPTHFAGLQVFFQAILNRNPMVYIYEHTPDQIGELIDEYDVTHISATPTFYRLRLQQVSGSFDSVMRLTSGGERFEPSLEESLLDLFPNAQFRNVYATTETGTLLESNDELFEIPEELSERIRINENNQLLVHKSLLGDDFSTSLADDWFHTGDVIEYVDEDRFRFVGRESDFVNVAGYRVSFHEIEKKINKIDIVDASVVTARESSVTGNVLVAKIQPARDVDPDIAKRTVKEAINDLERWKQPRVIDVVDTIDQSRAGKRIRREDT
jgi:acyl-coenzyme A synthetase/AMP-(fatty) acid ligase